MKITIDLRAIGDAALYTISAALYAELCVNDQALTRTMLQEAILEVERRGLDSKTLREVFAKIDK